MTFGPTRLSFEVARAFLRFNCSGSLKESAVPRRESSGRAGRESMQVLPKKGEWFFPVEAVIVTSIILLLRFAALLGG